HWFAQRRRRLRRLSVHLETTGLSVHLPNNALFSQGHRRSTASSPPPSLSISKPTSSPPSPSQDLPSSPFAEGVDIIQTEGGKCSKPSKSGVLGLIEKATPTLAAAYSISRAVKIPVMCSSGLSAQQGRLITPFAQTHEEILFAFSK
ncbi:unnamed protein product, partial [Linum tenue]